MAPPKTGLNFLLFVGIINGFYIGFKLMFYYLNKDIYVYGIINIGEFLGRNFYGLCCVVENQSPYVTNM